MKIKGTVIRNKKNEENLYNDGNKEYSSKEEKSIVENYSFNRENEIELNSDKNTNSKISYSLNNKHIKKIYNEDTQETISVPGDTNVGKDFLDPPVFKHYNTITKDQEIVGYEDSKDQEINLNNIDNASPNIINKNIIESNIDGEIGITNVQDKNISSDPSQSFEQNFGDFGEAVGKNAFGSLINNTIGITGKDINDVVGSFKNLTSEMSNYENQMNKLETWKRNKYKEFHIFDWKPGQTIPQDLMGGSVVSLVKDVANMPFIPKESRNEFNKTFNKIKEKISPDPINYVRNAIKITKGIGKESENISVQDDLYDVEYSKTENSDTIVSNWKKNTKLFNTYNKSEKDIRFINALKNKNTYNKTLGYIYIRPNYKYSSDVDKYGLGEFQIPFEFNPEISEGAVQSNYATESLMNRIGQFHIYTGTNLSQLSITIPYMALAPDELDKEMERNMAKQFSTDSWQYYWTNNRIEEIEYKLRSLVFPDVTSEDFLIKPPLIELHLGNNNGSSVDSVGDLFKYPIGIDPSNNSEDKKYLATTRSVTGSGINRYKKYLVTSVQIDKLNDDSFIWPSLYGRVWENGMSGSPINHIKTGADLGSKEGIGYNGYSRRTGFKAVLQCIEVVENFLDIVPDFKSYYDAWSFKNSKANITSEYAKIVLNENIQETTDFLNASINTSIANISSLEDRLDSMFKEAYAICSLYKHMKKRMTKLYAFDEQAKGNSKEDPKEEYYFANSNWPIVSSEEKKEDISKDIKKEEEKKDAEEAIDPNGPVIFKTELSTDIKPFFNTELNEKIKDIFSSRPEIIDTYKKIIKSDVYNLNNSFSSKTDLYGTSKFPLFDGYVNSEGIIKDYLGYGSDKELEEMNFICALTPNNMEKVTFTDQECFVMITIIKYIIDNYHNIIYNFPNYPDESEIYDYSFEKLYNEIDKVFEGGSQHAVDDSPYYNIIGSKSKNNYLGSILDSFSKMLNNYKKYLPNLINQTYEKFKLEYEKKGQTFNDTNLKKCYDLKNIAISVASDLESGYSEKDNFESLYNQIKLEDVISIAKYNYIIDDSEKFLKEYCDNIIRFKNVMIDIINYNFKTNDVMEKVVNSICLAMISEKNKVKKIRNYEKRIRCSITMEPFGKETDICKTKLGAQFTMGDYDLEDTDIKLLSISYIAGNLMDTYKKAQKNLSKLEVEISRFKLEKFNPFLSILKKVDNIVFLDIPKDDNYDICIDNLKKVLAHNEEQYLLLVNCIKQLKVLLSSLSIQKDFTNLVGYTKEEAIEKGGDIPAVPDLEKLSTGYVKYAKDEKALRNIVFKKWDEWQSIGNAESPEGGISNFSDYSLEIYGLIPNMYYKKLTAKDLQRQMEVAGNSIKIFDKLTT